MKSRLLLGALALFLLPGQALAFHGNEQVINMRVQGRAYSLFLSGYLAYRDGDFDAALESYRKALRYADNEPDILYEIGNVLVKKGNLAEAGESLRKVLSIDNTHTRSRYLLAGILAASGDKEKAIELYTQVVAADPENEEAYVHLATLFLEKGDFGKAEERLSDLIRKNPESFLGFYYRGRLFAARKKFAEALSDFDKALSMHPSYDGALIDSGGVLEMMGRNEEAEARYKRALEISPNNPFIRERLGRVLILENKIDQAVGHYEELKKFSSNNLEFRTRLGLLYLERDRFDDAVNEFRFVLSAQPENVQVRFFLGTAYEEKGLLTEAQEQFRAIPESSMVYREASLRLAVTLGRQKKFDESIGVLRKLRVKYPEDVEVMVFLGGQLEEAKRYPEAIGILAEATTRDPKNAVAYFSLGVVYDKTGDFGKLVSSMEKAIELDPKHAVAMNYLGYTYADRNMKLKEAESLILRALEIRPNDGYFIDSLAWVYYRQGDLKRAETELRRALTLVADDPVILEHLGDVLLKQGRDAEAAAFFEKSIAKGHEKPDEIRGKLSGARKETPPPEVIPGGVPPVARDPRGAGRGGAAWVWAIFAGLSLASGCAPSFQRIPAEEAGGAREFFAAAAELPFPVEASYSGVAEVSGKAIPFVVGVNARSPAEETVGFYDPLGGPVLFLANDGRRVTLSRGRAAGDLLPRDLPPLKSGPVSLGRILSGAAGYPVEAGELGRTPEGGWAFRDGRQRLASDPPRRLLSRAEYEIGGKRIVVSYPERETPGPPPVVRIEVSGAKIVLRRDEE